MTLEINEDELNALLRDRYLMPNLVTDSEEAKLALEQGLSTYLLEIVNAMGERRSISVVHHTKPRETSLSVTAQTTLANVSAQQTTLFANVDDWIDDWRAAWSGKRLKAMGDRATCLKNMNEFLKTYPRYTRDVVFKARDRYMSEFNGDYSYIEQADYFIKKQVYQDGEKQIRRTLLQYCEAVELAQKVLEQQSLLTTITPYDDI